MIFLDSIRTLRCLVRSLWLGCSGTIPIGVVWCSRHCRWHRRRCENWYRSGLLMISRMMMVAAVVAWNISSARISCWHVTIALSNRRRRRCCCCRYCEERSCVGRTISRRWREFCHLDIPASFGRFVVRFFISSRFLNHSHQCPNGGIHPDSHFFSGPFQSRLLGSDQGRHKAA